MTTPEHEIVVTGWDHYRPRIALRCHAGPEAPCHTIIDEDGANPQHVDYCNAVHWFNQCDPDDLIGGTLDGPPPWPVDITWTDDGPQIRQQETTR